MTGSLRLRLLFHTTVATALVLGLLGCAVYFSMRRSLLHEFDRGMAARAQALATVIEQSGQDVKMEYDPQQMPEFAARRRPDYFEVWLDDQQVLARSPSLGGGDLYHATTSAPFFQSIVLPDSRRGRALTQTIKAVPEHNDEPSPPAGFAPRNLVLTLATETTSLDQTLMDLRWLLTGLCGLAILISGAVLMVVVRHAVRPVERVAHEIGQLKETDLSCRLSKADVPEELGPVVEKLNGLLGRLEGAFLREKSFTADVAHELRTPLAGLQTTLEVCRSRPREAAAYIAAIDKCRALTDRMQAMVENLLLLARTESGQLAVKRQPVEIGNLLAECWAAFRQRAHDRGLQLQWTVPDAIFADTDADELRIVINNLFDNCVSYADENGSLRVRAGQTAGTLSIEVANTGSLIGPADAPRLFERFWRGDQARADTPLHCGLGLSLCQRLLNLINGGISVQTAVAGWFIVQITLPATQRQEALSGI